ncbi:hypothetical protein M407DRAFT_159082 [Tulasnella calospora MUT 4182]|uniref:Protein kinase domain-containing protein n=1 Tax=Tulasnella calospora MUT 4182 TaxID=1051891 RepID=A0A0C3KAL1_9AGAM|nr:hypothetical protein M407DRAFT_159082 [Tulasnella calospora MUT 4182]
MTVCSGTQSLSTLNPITKLSQPFHVPHIGWSILLAIEFLNEQGWFHRDISIGNTTG